MMSGLHDAKDFRNARLRRVLIQTSIAVLSLFALACPSWSDALAVNGVTLDHNAAGTGSAGVFVHGAISDSHHSTLPRGARRRHRDLRGPVRADGSHDDREGSCEHGPRRDDVRRGGGLRGQRDCRHHAGREPRPGREPRRSISTCGPFPLDTHALRWLDGMTCAWICDGRDNGHGPALGAMVPVRDDAHIKHQMASIAGGIRVRTFIASRRPPPAFRPRLLRQP